MALGVLATKKGMTQIFTEEGVRIPVTVLQVEPNHIIQKRSIETDGYVAVQIGYGHKNPKKVSKALTGHYKKAGAEPHRWLREFRCTPEEAEALEVGGTLGLGAVGEAKNIDVSGVSKGKGFAGVMKRHNMAGFRATHGTHEYFRHGGSIGCRAKPGRVFKGQKMPGQMGNERVTVQNLNLVQVDAEKGLLLVRGAVPGAKGAIIEVQVSGHVANGIPGLRQEAQTASKNPMKASKAGGK
ncbi:MAG: 50S ribosomal protein L3 [Planctomycetota bacterium]|jgi:large subunit ribosomal protein L3